MLRRRGIRVVSITEQADDTATGRLLEAIIESVDEFYSENLIPVIQYQLFRWDCQREIDVVLPVDGHLVQQQPQHVPPLLLG